MGPAESRRRFTPGLASAAPFAAAIGCLQPGIDPVFLMLLSNACHLPLAAHGMIVGGTQAGAAIGSLLVWRLGARLPHRAVVAAAGMALGCSLATPLADGVAAVLALRCGYGLAMGMVYAYAMAAYAAHGANRAYGAVFLIQLILSTLVSVGLPELELAIGQDGALAALALAPASALAALLLMTVTREAPDRIAVETRADVPAAGWALVAATFWFICSTMLVWSFTAALATSAGIANRTIGHAVAIGSIVGALTALAVMRDKPLLPLPIMALLSGAALASPIILIAPGQDAAFIASVILLNIGSTAIIIRCSGLATASSTDSRFRIFVACSHSLGLIAGPLLGATMMTLFGPVGLFGGALIALPAGLGAVVFAVYAGRPGRRDKTVSEAVTNNGSMARMALD